MRQGWARVWQWHACFQISGCTKGQYGADCSFRQGAKPFKGTYKGDLFLYFFRFFGPIWAHKGPYRPIGGPYRPVWARMGPARALEERESSGKTHIFCYVTILSSKINVLDLHIVFFDGFNLFFRLLAEIRFRTIMKLPQKTSSGTKRALVVPPSPCLK